MTRLGDARGLGSHRMEMKRAEHGGDGTLEDIVLDKRRSGRWGSGCWVTVVSSRRLSGGSTLYGRSRDSRLVVSGGKPMV